MDVSTREWQTSLTSCSFARAIYNRFCTAQHSRHASARSIDITSIMVFTRDLVWLSGARAQVDRGPRWSGDHKLSAGESGKAIKTLPIPMKPQKSFLHGDNVAWCINSQEKSFQINKRKIRRSFSPQAVESSPALIDVGRNIGKRITDASAAGIRECNEKSCTNFKLGTCERLYEKLIAIESLGRREFGTETIDYVTSPEENIVIGNNWPWCPSRQLRFSGVVQTLLALNSKVNCEKISNWVWIVLSLKQLFRSSSFSQVQGFSSM